MRFTLAALALLLFACKGEDLMHSHNGPPTREIGRIVSIYPHLLPSEEWVLEYDFAADTVYVDYKTAYALVQNGYWKEALTTRFHSFFAVDGDGVQCIYPDIEGIQGCLPFVRRDELYQRAE